MLTHLVTRMFIVNREQSLLMHCLGWLLLLCLECNHNEPSPIARMIQKDTLQLMTYLYLQAHRKRRIRKMLQLLS